MCSGNSPGQEARLRRWGGFVIIRVLCRAKPNVSPPGCATSRLRHDTIRHEMRSKADMSQLNLPHGTDN